MKSFGYAAQSKTSALTPFHFDRRELGAKDVAVAIELDFLKGREKFPEIDVFSLMHYDE
jgi:hypothetical protein